MLRKTKGMLLIGLFLFATIAPVQEVNAWGPVTKKIVFTLGGLIGVNFCLNEISKGVCGSNDDNYAGEIMRVMITIGVPVLAVLGIGGVKLIHKAGKILP